MNVEFPVAQVDFMLFVWYTIFLYLYQAKHFYCDYVFQTQYMLQKGNKTGWVKPLAMHSGCHAIGTLILLLAYGYVTEFSSWLIALFTLLDFASHFGIDRWKATRGSTPSERSFWVDLGIDQFGHHSFHIYFISTYTFFVWFLL